MKKVNGNIEVNNRGFVVNMPTGTEYVWWVKENVHSANSHELFVEKAQHWLKSYGKELTNENIGLFYAVSSLYQLEEEGLISAIVTEAYCAKYFDSYFKSISYVGGHLEICRGDGCKSLDICLIDDMGEYLQERFNEQTKDILEKCRNRSNNVNLSDTQSLQNS